ncbi:MAG: nickel-dependent hydrogenase large subunit [Aquificota bacterium]|nr:nickel-dependent hydrogenase large subunit [Aquificota bacterium]
MKRVVIDPVTRIEGHLRLEVVVDEKTGKVKDAVSVGTMWRGIEIILKGRDPRDAWAFTQRICGVCTSIHALASVRCVEDALEIKIPKNANYIRNIMYGSLQAHDHTVHFYHLHALDWVSPIEALKADPVATADLQRRLFEKYGIIDELMPDYLSRRAYPRKFPKSTPGYFRTFQEKIKKTVESGQLGIFAAHWWDHPDYKLLPPEVHLIAVAHYLNMLDVQREMFIPQVVFGGKNPHPHYVVGGMMCSISMDDMNAPVNPERLAVVEEAIYTQAEAVNLFYLIDLLAIGHAYLQKGWRYGGGLAKKRVLGYGEFPEEPYESIKGGDYHSKILYHCNGVVENFREGVDRAKYYPLTGKDLTDPEVIQEFVSHSWYSYGDDAEGLHPWDGRTEPNYTGPKEGTRTHWKYVDENGKYSWIKAPRWRGKPCEVGPLARYIITYTAVKQGHVKPSWIDDMVVKQIELVSEIFGLPPHVWMPTTVGRTVARGLEAQMAVASNMYFMKKLYDNIKAGDTTVANMDRWDPSTWPRTVKGVGVTEAPRGALGHWIVIEEGKIKNYQCVVPTTWNGSPRDHRGQQGAFEECMKDTVVSIPEKPVEILKGIRSFDPCLACSTHIYDTEGKELISIRVLGG